jgi:hypothetical protein
MNTSLKEKADEYIVLIINKQLDIKIGMSEIT